MRKVTVVWLLLGAVVRGAGLVQHGVPVELRMRRGVIAAVKSLLVRFLRAVVGKRLPRDLAPSQAPAIRERGKVDRIDGTPLLEEIEDFVGAFIHKGHCAHLDPDRLAGRRRFGGRDPERRSQGRCGGQGGQSGAGFDEFTAGEA